MEEKILVQSTNTYQKTFKKFCFIIFGLLIVSVIMIIVSHLMHESSWEKIDLYDWGTLEHDIAFDKALAWSDTFHNFIIISIIAVVVNVIVWIFYYAISKIQLVVTNKRVYGKTSFGKQVDLPLDSISAVGTSMFKGIAVGTSSGKISFMGMGNRDEIYEEIKKILANRQEKEIKVKAPVTNITQAQSSADELKKYKDLLDSGIISQEEFDAKKKQLLGL